MPPLAPQTPAGSATDALAQLRDIHLPQETISQLPTAPGWWILVLTALIMAGTAYLLWRRHQHRNQYRKEAQQLLSQLNAQDMDPQTFTRNINTLTKRAALAAYPGVEVTSRFGSQWTGFLKHSAPKLIMPDPVEYFLINSSYQRPNADQDTSAIQQQVLNYTEQWLTQHLSARGLARLAERG